MTAPYERVSMRPQNRSKLQTAISRFDRPLRPHPCLHPAIKGIRSFQDAIFRIIHVSTTCCVLHDGAHFFRPAVAAKRTCRHLVFWGAYHRRRGAGTNGTPPPPPPRTGAPHPPASVQITARPPQPPSAAAPATGAGHHHPPRLPRAAPCRCCRRRRRGAPPPPPPRRTEPTGRRRRASKARAPRRAPP